MGVTKEEQAPLMGLRLYGSTEGDRLGKRMLQT